MATPEMVVAARPLSFHDRLQFNPALVIVRSLEKLETFSPIEKSVGPAVILYISPEAKGTVDPAKRG